MSSHRYVGLIDGEKMRSFTRRDELNHWLQNKPEATFVRYTIKNPPKEKLNTNDYSEALF
jgi:hypothetical protein